jgi:hypothetical protein
VSTADAPRYSWTQPCCDDCWDREHPHNLSPRLGRGDVEVCVHCGKTTASGIYIRIDPGTAPHPSLTK